MFSRNYKRFGVFRNKNLFIESICKNKEYQSAEFRQQLTKLIAYCVEPEYIEAVYDAMTTHDNLDRTAIDFNVSVAQLSRKITKVKENWDRFFQGWRFVSRKNASEIAEDEEEG